MRADLLVDAKCQLGEGIQWREDQQRLWWTDIHGHALWSCDADGGDIVKIETIERLGSFAFDPEGRILAAFESGLFRWDLERDRLNRLTDFEPEMATTRLNDGRCDRAGRFVTGGMEESAMKPSSTMICYDGNKTEVLSTGVSVTNSICFSPDGQWMYFADTPTKIIRRYPYDSSTGEIGNPIDFFTVTERDGFPDGSCVDAAGSLWNARFWGGRVQEITSDGAEGRRIDLDAPQVTCCCFGGPKLDRLYITTAREHFSDEQAADHPLSGGIFVAEPGATGLFENRFARCLFTD